MASMHDLHEVLSGVRSDHPKLSNDNAFVVWFSDAYLIGDQRGAFEGVIGGPGDQGVDAVYVDDRAGVVQLVQGKYHLALANDNAAVRAFGQLAAQFWDNSGAIWKQAGAGAKKKLHDAYEALHSKKKRYSLRLYFATSGNVTPSIADKVRKTVQSNPRTELEVLDHHGILGVLSDWLDGAAPPLPELALRIDGPEPQLHGTRKDHLKAWVFTTTSEELSGLYKKAGERLFARNVRGYLRTRINNDIKETAKKSPELFWYLNNGITIVAESAEQRKTPQRCWIQMRNPQVVNGQQTVRVLAEAEGKKCHVLVRLIVLPKDQTTSQGVTGMVGKIVQATNRQNAIRQADLMANDSEQVRVEREFRKLGYLYVRKRERSSEVTAKAGPKYQKISKDELANALSATDIGPQVVRRQEQWDDSNYHKIFRKSRDPREYLARYLLGRRIEDAANKAGGPTDRDARWVVMDVLWQWSNATLGDFIKTKTGSGSFCGACEEKDRRVLNPLHSAARKLFVCARKVYEIERRKEAKRNKRLGKPYKVLSPDAFFRRVEATHLLEKALRSDKPRRQAVKKFLERFVASMAT